MSHAPSKDADQPIIYAVYLRITKDPVIHVDSKDSDQTAHALI